MKMFIFPLILIFPLVLGSEQRISDVNVLLPTCSTKGCTKVIYTVRAFGGCFSWSVDEPEALNLKQLALPGDKPNCYSAVEISGKSKDEKVLWLTAKETQSNEFFHCKVGFAELQRVDVERHFNYMNAGEVLELKAIGFDSQGNIFNSLEGLSFLWKISSTNIAQISKISTEKKEISPLRKEIEKNLFSEIIILKGLSAGSLMLSAEIKDQNFKQMQSQDHKIYVLEPFTVIPKETLYILPLNAHTFGVELVQTVGAEKLKAKLKNYNWALEGGKCGKVNQKGLYDSPNQSCNNTLVVKDKRIDRYNSQKRLIKVVEATSLELGMKEVSEAQFALIKAQGESYSFDSEIEQSSFLNSHWNLVEGKFYLVKNILLHDIHPVYYKKGNVEFKIQFGELSKHIQIEHCYFKAEVCLIKALKKTENSKELSSETVKGLKNKFKTQKTVKIVSPVRIQKFARSYFLLPFLGEESQFLRLLVEGGTGFYNFTSSNTEVVDIKEEVLFGKARGSAVIRIRDADIKSNYDEIEIRVNDMVDFTYFEPKMEVETGKEAFVGVQALNKEGETFTACSEVVVKEIRSELEVSLQEFEQVRDFAEKESKEGYPRYSLLGICKLLSGFSEEEAIFNVSLTAEVEDAVISAKKAAKVSYFNPLRVSRPDFSDLFTQRVLKHLPRIENRLAILPGVKFDLELTGGVNIWPDTEIEFTEQFFSLNKQGKSQLEQGESFKIAGKGKKFSLFCTEGEHKIKVELQNSKSEELIRPKLSEIELTITCLKPNFVSIFPLSEKAELEPFSKDFSEDNIFNLQQKEDILYFVRTKSVTEVRVYGFDERKRMIANYSQMEGSFQEDSLYEIQRKESKHPEFGRFDFNFLKNSGLVQAVFKDIHSAVFSLIDFPEIVPKFKTLYLHPENKAVFKIKNGSGNFNLVTDSDVASASMKDRIVEVTPNEEGLFTFVIEDQNIQLGFEVSATVLVSPIKQLLLTGGGLVPVNTPKQLDLTIFANDDKVFDFDQIKLMKLQMKEFESMLVSEFRSAEDHTLSFDVTGQLPSVFPVSLTETNSLTISNVQTVEVFSKLDIFPPYLLMTPGMTHSLTIRGGPQSQHKVIRRLHMEDTKIAALHEENILVEALKLGKTTALVKLFYEKESEETLLCEDTVEVEVRIPDGLDIRYAYNRRVFKESTVKLLSGLKYQGRYFNYGNMNMHYDWSNDLDQVVTFKRIESCDGEYKTGCERESSRSLDSVGVFMKSNNIGVVELSLAVNLEYPDDYYYEASNFNATERIVVENRLTVKINDYYDLSQEKTSFYLLPPNSEHDLKVENQGSVRF